MAEKTIDHCVNGGYIDDAETKKSYRTETHKQTLRRKINRESHCFFDKSRFSPRLFIDHSLAEVRKEVLKQYYACIENRVVVLNKQLEGIT